MLQREIEQLVERDLLVRAGELVQLNMAEFSRHVREKALEEALESRQGKAAGALLRVLRKRECLGEKELTAMAQLPYAEVKSCLYQLCLEGLVESRVVKGEKDCKISFWLDEAKTTTWVTDELVRGVLRLHAIAEKEAVLAKKVRLGQAVELLQEQYFKLRYF